MSARETEFAAALQRLESAEALKRTKAPVPATELAALTRAVDARHAAATEIAELAGAYRALSGAFASRRRIALALDLPEAGLAVALAKRLSGAAPEPARAVAKDLQPLKGDAALPSALHDILSVVSLGVILAHEAGGRSDGCQRLAGARLEGDAITVTALVPGGMERIAVDDAEAALVLGAAPASYLAALLAPYADLPASELAARLAEGRLPPPRRLGNALELPGDAEIEIRGRLTGFDGVGGRFVPERCFAVAAPTLLLPLAGSREWLELEALAVELQLARHVALIEGGIDLIDVRSYPETGNLLAAVKLRPKVGGQSKTAAMAALSSPTIKPRCVIGVDDDIDLTDLREIAWSMASRIDAALDVQTIAGLPEEASAGSIETATKWFVDSTKPPLTQPAARADFERALPKGFERIRLTDYLRR